MWVTDRTGKKENATRGFWEPHIMWYYRNFCAKYSINRAKCSILRFLYHPRQFSSYLYRAFSHSCLLRCAIKGFGDQLPTSLAWIVAIAICSFAAQYRNLETYCQPLLHKLLPLLTYPSQWSVLLNIDAYSLLFNHSPSQRNLRKSSRHSDSLVSIKKEVEIHGN